MPGLAFIKHCCSILLLPVTLSRTPFIEELVEGIQEESLYCTKTSLLRNHLLHLWPHAALCPLVTISSLSRSHTQLYMFLIILAAWFCFLLTDISMQPAQRLPSTTLISSYGHRTSENRVQLALVFQTLSWVHAIIHPPLSLCTGLFYQPTTLQSFLLTGRTDAFKYFPLLWSHEVWFKFSLFFLIMRTRVTHGHAWKLRVVREK